MSLIVLYFLHDTSVLSFYIDVALTLSIYIYRKSQYKLCLTVIVDICNIVSQMTPL